jgi:hypothetical protein
MARMLSAADRTHAGIDLNGAANSAAWLVKWFEEK